MNLTGKLVGASKDFQTGKMRITFEVEDTEQVMKRFDVEKMYLLDVDTKKHVEKRSKGANALFHKWVGALADVTGNSKAYTKNWLLYQYGQFETDNDGNPVNLIVPAKDVNFWTNNETVHVWPVKFYPDDTCGMVVVRASKTLNSDEFKVLLNGTKADCESAGIDTISDDEIAHIASLWKAENE